MNTIDHFELLVLVTGLSGAGKSTANKAFSDFGFYTIDNLPVEMMHSFLELSKTRKDKFKKSCILLDVISKEKTEELLTLIDSFGKNNEKLKLLFLDCSTETIIKRYSETRRPHPGFNLDRDKGLADTVERERSRLAPLKERADTRFDTTNLNVHDLKRKLKESVDGFLSDGSAEIRVNFLSFGFKYGLPLDCDLVADVRFLTNPYFIDELKEKTGQDKEVRDYVMSSNVAKEFVEQYKKMLQFLLPHYSHEGKAYLNIGIGCTGGKHRSVAIAELLAEIFQENDRYISVSHRDITR